MRPSRLRHRVQATFAILGTVAAVFGISRVIKAKAHPPPLPSPVVAYVPAVSTAPIIPRTLPPVTSPTVAASRTAELVHAASEGDVDRMEARYEPGMRLDGAMLAAAEAGRANAIAWLLDHGATADDPGVLLAADASPAVVTLLFAKGAREVTLASAAQAGATNAVTRILAKGGAASDPNATGEDGTTPLTYAVDGGHVRIVRALIARGARVDETHLETAMRESEDGRSPVLGALLAGRIPSEVLSHALSDAIERGDVAGARAMIGRGAPVNRTTELGERPLAKAAAAGDARMVALLVDHGASVNAGLASWDDETALEAAEAAGHYDVARILRARGARRRAVFD